MRVILVVIGILLIASTIFFFGWIQLKVGESQHAVIFTKTRGWEGKVIRPGTFTWRWERLLPTNLTLHLFDTSPRTTSISIEGDLPGAELYQEIFEYPPDFGYDISFSVRYRIRPEVLPTLAKDEGLNPENVVDWYGHIEGEMLDIAVEAVESAASQLGNGGTGGFVAAGLGPAIEIGFEQMFSGIEIDSVTPHRFSLPDYALYDEARRLYFSTLQVKNDTVAETLKRATEEKVNQELKLDLLERYGELLTKYPVILDYLALDNVDLSEMLPDLTSFGSDG